MVLNNSLLLDIVTISNFLFPGCRGPEISLGIFGPPPLHGSLDPPLVGVVSPAGAGVLLHHEVRHQTPALAALALHLHRVHLQPLATVALEALR